jgi:phosphatidate cytidylyltransferase
MLLSNPMASPLWPRLAYTFLGLFGASFLALLVHARGHLRNLSGSELFKRWRTWIVIAGIFSLAALAGPLPLAIYAAALAVVAAHEYSQLVALPGRDTVLLMLSASAIPLCAVKLSPQWLALLLPLLASLPALLAQDIQDGPKRVAHLAFGLWYAPLTLALLVTIERDHGPSLVLGLAMATALSDVGAFTTGKLLGRFTPPLAARLSPSKTVAGAVGNLAGAALGLQLVAPAFLLLAPAVALGAVWGDLLESLLKRAAGVKDAGKCLPGFGGVLDRLDSLLVVLPLSVAALAVLP